MILDSTEQTPNIEGLQIDVGGLKTDVGLLKTEVAELKTDAGVLKTNVGLLQTDVVEPKENQEITRNSVNLLPDWADRSDRVLNIGLYEKAEQQKGRKRSRVLFLFLRRALVCGHALLIYYKVCFA